MLAADTSRNLLYALVAGSMFASGHYQIDVYDLGPN